ncbi:NAD(P)-binding domain-containing protein [Methylobacterium sp. WSM2598]|uniref:NAD(P)-binding domain-containing protein n=1 Tax=Methylobacterium sp. WSM2598 TaxID=398261 RepID=UPI0003A7CF86|nr:NAD(P)-binding domain-containing protein [Methylobacterium sp. WSM2598]
MPVERDSSVVIVGAGPYGLSISAHLTEARIPHRIFGAPMSTWRSGMPTGMLLKSHGLASNLSDPGRAYSLSAYCREQGIYYDDHEWSVPVEVFAAYGEAFHERLVPHLEQVTVRSVRRASSGFDITLADSRPVFATHIVLATGLQPFAHLPPEFATLPEGLVSHSCDAANLTHFAGRHVAVIGGGASAVDVAASLHRAGARATIIARRNSLRFYPPRAQRHFDWLRAPPTPLGPGWKKFLCSYAPLLFRQLPSRLRIDLVRRHLGPTPAWSVKEIIDAHVRVISGARVEQVRAERNCVQLTVVANAERQLIEADHVIAATGYRVSLDRLNYLDSCLRSEIRCLEGSPVLSARFETSVPGLFIVGTPAAVTFGPLLRFVCGTEFTARRLTGAFRGLERNFAVGATARATTSPGPTHPRLTDVIASGRLAARIAPGGAAPTLARDPDSSAVRSSPDRRPRQSHLDARPYLGTDRSDRPEAISPGDSLNDGGAEASDHGTYELPCCVGSAPHSSQSLQRWNEPGVTSIEAAGGGQSGSALPTTSTT